MNVFIRRACIQKTVMLVGFMVIATTFSPTMTLAEREDIASNPGSTQCTPPANGCQGSGNYSCINGTCRASSCGDGVCNNCSGSFSPCFATEDSSNCSQDCRSTPPGPTTAPPATGPAPTITAPDGSSGSSAGEKFVGTKSFQDNIRIAHGASHYYYFAVDKSNTGKTILVHIGSRDYCSKQNLMVKKDSSIPRAEYDSIANCFVVEKRTDCKPGRMNSVQSQYSSNGPEYWFNIDRGITYTSSDARIKNAQPGTYHFIIADTTEKNVSPGCQYYRLYLTENTATSTIPFRTKAKQLKTKNTGF